MLGFNHQRKFLSVFSRQKTVFNIRFETDFALFIIFFSENRRCFAVTRIFDLLITVIKLPEKHPPKNSITSHLVNRFFDVQNGLALSVTPIEGDFFCINV